MPRKCCLYLRQETSTKKFVDKLPDLSDAVLAGLGARLDVGKHYCRRDSCKKAFKEKLQACDVAAAAAGTSTRGSGESGPRAFAVDVSARPASAPGRPLTTPGAKGHA